MARWILNVETNCADPKREKEFNDWYDRTHLFDVLETPGMVRASRYEYINPPEGQPKFMAMYEVETEDMDKTMAAFSERVNDIIGRGRLSDLAVIVNARVYRQITAPVGPK